MHSMEANVSGADHLVYTDAQVSDFLNYIALPVKLHSSAPSLALLNQLHTHTIARLPYENLSLHYNASHSISLDPHVLFEKIVTRANGRGGYCMEVALLYHYMLKALGFEVYTAPAKNRNRVDGVPVGDWRSWVHITNIVIFRPPLSARLLKISSDVAFGGDGPTVPLPLDSTLVHSNMGPQEIRLAREWLPEQTWRPEGEEGEAQKYWIYQYRNGPTKPWNSFYAFLEMEFTPTDWERVSGFTSARGFIHMETVLVVKFLGRRKDSTDGDLEIYGKRMLVDGVVKENLGGRTQVVLECTSEKERLDALRQYFDIDLGRQDEEAISGWHTELRS